MRHADEPRVLGEDRVVGDVQGLAAPEVVVGQHGSLLALNLQHGISFVRNILQDIYSRREAFLHLLKA